MNTLLGHTDNGEAVTAVEIVNANGMRARILNYGAIIQQLWVPQASAPTLNVVLGFTDWRHYLTDQAYLGAMIGRCCNRIRGAAFTLNNEQYELNANLGAHQLHGGGDGFNRRIWVIEDVSANSVTLTLRSPHGDQGYPGNLDIRLRYTLELDNCLAIEWQATTDRDTVVNLTNHSYFNLAGGGDILDHRLSIAASRFTPVDTDIIPSGETAPVANTLFDLREPRVLRSVVDSPDPMLSVCGGLDHNFVLDHADGESIAAELCCPNSGLSLQVMTTQPAIQCYTGNSLQSGGHHANRTGICLETQDFPNAVNEPGFPSIVLNPGTVRRHTSRYRFANCTQ